MHRIGSNVRSGRCRLRAPSGRESTYSREGKRRAKCRGWIGYRTREEIDSRVATSPVWSVSAGGVAPAIVSSEPVTNVDPSEAGYRMPYAMSSGSPMGPSGANHTMVQTTSASAVRRRHNAPAQSVTRLSPQGETGRRAAQVREPTMRRGVTSPRPAVSLGPRGTRTGLLDGPPSAQSLPLNPHASMRHSPTCHSYFG